LDMKKIEMIDLKNKIESPKIVKWIVITDLFAYNSYMEQINTS
jgi:hypothetical protein